jgi:hypothetical protein
MCMILDGYECVKNEILHEVLDETSNKIDPWGPKNRAYWTVMAVRINVGGNVGGNVWARVGGKVGRNVWARVGGKVSVACGPR